MPTKRKRLQRAVATRINAEAHEAWGHADRIALHRALRLPPWQASPLDAVDQCPWPQTTAGAATWADSVSLREGLQNADQAHA